MDWARYYFSSRWFWGALIITVGLLIFFAIYSDPPWGFIAMFIPGFALISLAEYVRVPGFRRVARVRRTAASSATEAMPTYDEWNPSRPLIGKLTQPTGEELWVSVVSSSWVRPSRASAIFITTTQPHEIIDAIPSTPYIHILAQLSERKVRFLVQDRRSVEIYREIWDNLL